MEEKKSGNMKLTIILSVALGAVVLAVAIPAIIGSREPEVVQAPPQAPAVQAPATVKPVAAAPAPENTAGSGGPGGEDVNSWCRSYVFTRCNAMKIPGSACLPIADAGAAVKRSMGVAGCRGAVDDLLLSAADDARRESPVAGEVPVAPEGATPGQPKLEPWVPQPGQEIKGSAMNRAAAEKAAAEAAQAAQGGPRVIMKQPTQSEIDDGMTRIRQLEDEIAVQRNTYVGTNIGVQSRLDEMREIATKLNTDEARGVYNQMLQKVGATAPQPPPGPNAGESAPVQAAPASF